MKKKIERMASAMNAEIGSFWVSRYKSRKRTLLEIKMIVDKKASFHNPPKRFFIVYNHSINRIYRISALRLAEYYEEIPKKLIEEWS